MIYFSAFTSYNPALPFTMKFPGPAFCDGKQKLMIIATLPLTVRKVNFDTILVNICMHTVIFMKITRNVSERMIYTNYEL